MLALQLGEPVERCKTDGFIGFRPEVLHRLMRTDILQLVPEQFRFIEGFRLRLQPL